MQKQGFSDKSISEWKPRPGQLVRENSTDSTDAMDFAFTSKPGRSKDAEVCPPPPPLIHSSSAQISHLRKCLVHRGFKNDFGDFAGDDREAPVVAVDERMEGVEEKEGE
jgi:hypothetical protein